MVAEYKDIKDAEMRENENDRLRAEIAHLREKIEHLTKMKDSTFDTIKEAYKKFCEPGFGLTDTELDMLLEHMTKLEELLLPLGARFFLARKEVSGVVSVCHGWKREREETNK